MLEEEFEIVKNKMNYNFVNRTKKTDNDLRNARNIANMIYDFCADNIFKTAEDVLSEEAMYFILETLKENEEWLIKKDKTKAYVKLNHIADAVESLYGYKIDRYKAGYYVNENFLCSCGNKPVFMDSKKIYGKSYGMVYYCPFCKEYVGVHNGTNIPLGTIADKETKKYRMQAHNLLEAKFGKNKTKAYKWIRKTMHLSNENAHIGKFDKDDCIRLIELINR